MSLERPIPKTYQEKPKYKPKRLTDAWVLFKKLTLRKSVNYALLFGSYFISKFTKKDFQAGNPFSISIEPTTSCNLRCPECPSGLRSFTRPTGMLDPSFFRHVIDQVAPDLVYLTFYFQGEPYLNPHFLEMANYASKKGIYTSTSTNAHYLDDEKAKATVESGLDRLIISIDGLTQEVYENYRVGGKLEKVLAGTEKILKWKKELKSQTPHVIFQFLVVKPNEHQIDDLYALAADVGVDEVKLKTAQIYDYKNGSPLIPTQDKYSRYAKQSDGSYTIKGKQENSCWRMWQGCVITWDGGVVPCCFDKDASHSLGGIKAGEKSFHDIWRGEKYKAFRKAILISRKSIEICKNCTEGLKVWA